MGITCFVILGRTGYFFSDGMPGVMGLGSTFYDGCMNMNIEYQMEFLYSS